MEQSLCVSVFFVVTFRLFQEELDSDSVVAVVYLSLIMLLSISGFDSSRTKWGIFRPRGNRFCKS